MIQTSRIVMIDLAPRALLERLQHGLIYPPARARAGRQHFFQELALVDLRALALQYTSHVIEAAAPVVAVPHTTRLVLCIEPDPASAALVRRGHRVARCLDAECYAVCVSRHGDLSELTPEACDTVERMLNYARGLGMDARILEGEDIAKTLVAFARLYDARHLILPRHATAGVRRIFGGRRGLAQQVVRLATDIQIHVVAGGPP